MLMRRQIQVFVSLTLAALLALGATASRAADTDKKAPDNDAASKAELERKLADARKRLDEAAREVANLSMSLSDDVVPHMRGAFGTVMGAPRAILGINLGTNDEPKGGGVEIVSVSPGGAAAEAGLKAGDVLTDINGTALKQEGDESAREKLLSSMRKVKPGDTVAVGYRRDNKALKASLVAQPLRDRFFTMAVPPGPGIPAVPPMPNFVFMRGEGVFGSAELVPMTAKLGQYFGTDTGLLVVRAPDDSRLKLEDGDVIVDIDGRTPSSPSHALRILSSYQPGEKLKLNILRTKKRMSFEVTVPEDTFERHFEGPRMERGFMRYAPSIEAMPAPPPPPLPDEPV